MRVTRGLGVFGITLKKSPLHMSIFDVYHYKIFSDDTGHSSIDVALVTHPMLQHRPNSRS